MLIDEFRPWLEIAETIADSMRDDVHDGLPSKSISFAALEGKLSDEEKQCAFDFIVEYMHDCEHGWATEEVRRIELAAGLFFCRKRGEAIAANPLLAMSPVGVA